MKRIALAHPTGNENTRQVLCALEQLGVLSSYFTSIAVLPDQWFFRRLPQTLQVQLSKRKLAPEIFSKTTCYPWREIGRLLSHRFPWKYLNRSENSFFSIDQVHRALSTHFAKSIARHNYTGVYCYEDGALEAFQAAKKRNITCYYDLPIAYHETLSRLLLQEAEKWPEWAITLQGTQHSEEKKARKSREIELSDEVICPSRFVFDSLPESILKTKKCHIARFGCDLLPVKAQPRNHDKLRVLFAGSHSQRKGLADLFSAIRQLKSTQVEILSVGSLLAPQEFYLLHCPQLQYHPPRPREEVLELMQSCDILALPSIVEGRALVQLEALSCGLPLLITPNTGGEDLIVEGQTGFMVPVGNPQQLAEKIDWFASHRAQLPQMRQACIEHAKTIQWENYRAEIGRILTALP